MALGTIAGMRHAISIIAFSCLAAVPSAAGMLGVGMPMPALTLTDQHDVEGTIGANTRCVLFSRDMDSANIVKEALADDPALLAAADGMVVSDISAMPTVITKLFAVPAMRKRPYRMLLDRDGKVTADIPADKGKVTWLRLDALSVRSVEYIGSVDALRAVLRQAAAERPTTPAPATP